MSVPLFLEYFESIDDTRQQGKVFHKLFDIIF